MQRWSPPDDWIRIRTIDAHTGGEPFRIITGGLPPVPGDSILERRRYARENLDHYRRALMLEPRGHPDMYGCIVTPPDRPDSDIGVLFLHNEGYSTMCGHGIIALSKVMVETGWVEAKWPITELRIDAPAGQIIAQVHLAEEGAIEKNHEADSGDSIVQPEVTHVSFLNVPSFVAELNCGIEVEGIGAVSYDLAFGGAFYAYVNAQSVGLSCKPENARELIEKGMLIKRAIMTQRDIVHPFDADLGFLYGTIFIAEAEDASNHSRNVCVFAEGEVDRSPTGTGVSGRLALHHARGEIDIGEQITIESIIGSTFTGEVTMETQFGDFNAIIPRVEGTAHITGRHEFLIDPSDSLKTGFFLR